MTLPKHADELCFSTDVFLKEDFTVDDFVNQCRKRVTIECLRDDLDAYYRTLKSAMVELINKDYADFVNLSANLVGVDKSIDGLATPLTQLKEDVSSIKEAMDTAISATERKLAKREEIRAKKTMLKRLIVVMESLESLERLLKIRRKFSATEEKLEIEQLSEREEFAAVVLERVAGEFNRLQFNVSQTDNHPLISEITPRIAAVTSALQSRLEQLFQEALDQRDREKMAHSLQAYASISRQEDAESMFQTTVVHPYLDKSITLKALTSEGTGLSRIYSSILDFFPKQCLLLLELTHPRPASGQPPRVPGFDFLVNAVWPEVVAMIEERISVIFAPGNPELFHKNYTETMKFVASFEAQCPTQGSVRRLRAHSSFTAFLSKWSLPVYFQIRFQEIAGALENSLSLSPAQGSRPGTPSFKMELFQALWDCLCKCWSEDVFLPALAHRFWKLTVQLIIRTSKWLHNQCAPEQSAVTASQSGVTDSLTVPQNLCLIHDCKLFTRQVEELFSTTVIPRVPLKTLKSPTAVKDCMQETVYNIKDLIPKFADSITLQVSQSCSRNLEPAHTIPRLYRRTNREVPQGPSSYVGSIFKPLAQLKGDIPVDYEQEWNVRIIEQVTVRYYEITSEVLMSVKRTEDSLMKLRRKRQSLLPASGMSDDNKIRLQLALDMEEYNTQVQKFVTGSDVRSLGQLLETGRAAKTLALTSSSSSTS